MIEYDVFNTLSPLIVTDQIISYSSFNALKVFPKFALEGFKGESFGITIDCLNEGPRPGEACPP